MVKKAVEFFYEKSRRLVTTQRNNSGDENNSEPWRWQELRRVSNKRKDFFWRFQHGALLLGFRTKYFTQDGGVWKIWEIAYGFAIRDMCCFTQARWGANPILEPDSVVHHQEQNQQGNKGVGYRNGKISKAKEMLLGNLVAQ